MMVITFFFYLRFTQRPNTFGTEVRKQALQRRCISTPGTFSRDFSREHPLGNPFLDPLLEPEGEQSSTGEL